MLSVKQKIIWLWQNAEKILIILFFLTFTLNVRKVFLTSFSFLNGGFNEYMALSISWADALIIGAIFIYTIKSLFGQQKNPEVAISYLNNKIKNKSSVIRNYYGNIVSHETFWVLLFLGWAGLSVFWSQSRPIAAYRFLVLTEILLFALISIKSLKSTKWLKASFFALVINGLAQSLLGIAQFVKNGSVGLRILGESILGPNIDGVAKVVIESEKYIRAYGTFPHPNILAGFLAIPLFLLIAEIATRRSNVSRETLLDFIPKQLLWILGIAIALGFVLTFSRSAFLGLFAGMTLFFCFLLPSRKLVSKHLVIPIIFAIVVAIAAFIFPLQKYSSFFSSQSMEERRLYQIVSYETISADPIRGIGIGQFVLNEYKKHPTLESWQYQPAHNIYLLVFSELGIVGFVLFSLFLIFIIFKILTNTTVIIPYYGFITLTYIVLRCIIISFLVISFFDHYFWDIKSGTIIFALPFIFLFSIQLKEIDEN